MAFLYNDNEEGGLPDMTQDDFAITQITRTAGTRGAVDPKWSPDGTHITFSNYGYQYVNFCIVKPDGSDLTQIPLTERDGVIRGVKWYLNGRVVAFTCDNGDERNRYVVTPDGSKIKKRHVADKNDPPEWLPQPTMRIDLIRARQEHLVGFGAVKKSSDGKVLELEYYNDKMDIYVTMSEGADPVLVTDTEGIGNSGTTNLEWCPDHMRYFPICVPEWSPNGEYIAFSHGDYGNRKICVVKADGSERNTIEHTAVNDEASDMAWLPGDAYFEKWSPDGTLLALQSNSGAYVIRPDGTNVTKLAQCEGRTSEPEGITFYCSSAASLEWSPDGTYIAFLDCDNETGSDICIAKSDGTVLTRISRPESHGLGGLGWSPDGTRIAFTDLDSDGAEDAYVISPDGSQLKQITHRAQGYEIHDLVWSPDGTRIAFIADAVSKMDAYVCEPDGSGLTQVFHAQDDDLINDPNWSRAEAMSPFFDRKIVIKDLQWSPDATRIAFVYQYEGKRDLYSVKPDGSDLTQVTYAPEVDEPYDPEERSLGINEWEWSPDGTYIAFSSESDETGFDHMFVIKSDGSELTHITHQWDGDPRVTTPVWSPDGTYIAFNGHHENAHTMPQLARYLW